MPQASDELRKLVAWIIQPKLHTEVPDDGEVCKFLEARGYVLTKEWKWQYQGPVSVMEELCLRYLVDEWDYGWLEDID